MCTTVSFKLLFAVKLVSQCLMTSNTSIIEKYLGYSEE